MVDFLKRKHTTITQLVTILLTAAVGIGRATGWYNLPESVVAGWGTLAAILWAAVGAQTVTSNVRLTGTARAGKSGITVGDVAAANGLVRKHDQPTAPQRDLTDDEIDADLKAAGLA